MSGLPRVVLKWLQSFDLTYPVQNPKWDLSNGYAIAEVLTCYYPKDILMYCYNNGQSLQSKMQNWSLLKKFLVTKNINLSFELIDATLHCKEGAAILLMEELYKFLTKKPVQKAPLDYDVDFTDWPYQQQLPYHARSTAAKSIKNNLKASELETAPNVFYSKHRAQSLVETHFRHTREDRERDPERFDRKPTIAELCARRPLPVEREETRFTLTNFDNEFDYRTFKPISKENRMNERQLKSSTVHLPIPQTGQQNFKEISVRQDSYAPNLGVVN